MEFVGEITITRERKGEKREFWKGRLKDSSSRFVCASQVKSNVKSVFIAIYEVEQTAERKRDNEG